MIGQPSKCSPDLPTITMQGLKSTNNLTVARLTEKSSHAFRTTLLTWVIMSVGELSVVVHVHSRRGLIGSLAATRTRLSL